MTIDSKPEIDELVAICRILGQKVSVLLRLGGLPVTRVERNVPAPLSLVDSKFGVAVDAVPDLLQQWDDQLPLRGFAFHIDNHSVTDRGEAIAIALQAVEMARSCGHDCRLVNIGGGFTARYVELASWNQFIAAHASEPTTFRGRTFGSRLADGKVIRGNFYPYDLELTRGKFLAAILDHEPDGHDRPVADLIRAAGVKLAIEPGKALVDQAGIVLTRIRGVKSSPLGAPLALCEMSMPNLLEQVIGSEFAADPILLPQTGGPPRHSFHIAGESCLEGDMLAWRLVPFPRAPRRGDLLAFVNVAGYQMDLLSSSLHRKPMPQCAAAFQDRGVWRWLLDTETSLVDLTE